MPTGHKKTPPNRSSARRDANRPLGGPHARHPARPGRSCGCRPRSACIWRTPFSRMLKCGPCAPNPAGRAFRFSYGSCTCRASQNVSNKKKHPAFQQGASCLHDPYGNRTHVTAVKGPCLNRLTNGPYEYKISLKQQVLCPPRLQPTPVILAKPCIIW